MLKIADFANFGPKYLGPQIFPRHAVCGSKLAIQSSFTYMRVGVVRIFNDALKCDTKCPYFPHLGPVGCLPVPNIFPLAKETFAIGKMFWNTKTKGSLFKLSNSTSSKVQNRLLQFQLVIPLRKKLQEKALRQLVYEPAILFEKITARKNRLIFQSIKKKIRL